MPIIAKNVIVKSQVQPEPEPQPIQVPGAPSFRIKASNINIINQVKEDTPPSVITKKKQKIFLEKRNRTGIFNLESPSAYMVDMLAIQE